MIFLSAWIGESLKPFSKAGRKSNLVKAIGDALAKLQTGIPQESALRPSAAVLAGVAKVSFAPTTDYHCGPTRSPRRRGRARSAGS